MSNLEKYGTFNYYLEALGASVVVRDRKRGEVMCFRPDIESAQKAAEQLEATGTLGAAALEAKQAGARKGEGR